MVTQKKKEHRALQHFNACGSFRACQFGCREIGRTRERGFAIFYLPPEMKQIFFPPLVGVPKVKSFISLKHPELATNKILLSRAFFVDCLAPPPKVCAGSYFGSHYDPLSNRLDSCLLFRLRTNRPSLYVLIWVLTSWKFSHAGTEPQIWQAFGPFRPLIAILTELRVYSVCKNVSMEELCL